MGDNEESFGDNNKNCGDSLTETKGVNRFCSLEGLKQEVESGRAEFGAVLDNALFDECGTNVANVLVDDFGSDVALRVQVKNEVKSIFSFGKSWGGEVEIKVVLGTKSEEVGNSSAVSAAATSCEMSSDCRADAKTIPVMNAGGANHWGNCKRWRRIDWPFGQMKFLLEASA